MSELRDPPRWIEPSAAGPSRMRDLLRAGRDDGPTDDQASRLASRLAPLATTSPPEADPRGSGTTGGPPISGAGNGGGAWLHPWFVKIGLASIVTIGGASTWLALRPSEPDRAPSTAAIATAQPAPATTDPAPSAAPIPAAEAPSNDATTSAADAAPSNDAPASAAGPSPSVATSAAPPATSAPSARSTASSSAGSPDEMTLLDRAQKSLATSPDRALALTVEHASRFPGGTLAPEREVIAITALVELGRTVEARARAERFRAANPRSAYLRRIDVLLAAAPPE